MQDALDSFKENYPTLYDEFPDEYVSIDEDDGTIFYVGKGDKEESRYWEVELTEESLSQSESPDPTLSGTCSQLKEINSWKLNDANDIVEEFGLGEAFKKKYGVSVDEFEYDDIGEIIVVKNLLDNIPNRSFYSTFIETTPNNGDGYYHIVEFENIPLCRNKPRRHGNESMILDIGCTLEELNQSLANSQEPEPVIKNTIQKTVTISHDGKQFMIRLPKEISDFLSIKKKDKLQLTVNIHETFFPEHKNIPMTMQVIEP